MKHGFAPLKQWKHWFSTHEKFKQSASVCKVLDFVLGDSESVIKVDHLEKGKTINVQCIRIKTNERSKQLKMLRKPKACVLLLRDNTLVHTKKVVTVNCYLLRFGFLDLLPFDIIRFPLLKSFLRGHHFGNNDWLLCVVEEFIEDQNATICRDGIAVLKPHSFGLSFVEFYAISNLCVI